MQKHSDEVVIDSNLSWEKHIERTCSRISHNLFIINKLSKILDLNERKTLYYGLIYPLLSYGIALWGHIAKANTTRIFALRGHSAKAITTRIFALQKKGSKIHCRAKTFGIVKE
jgi:hypothetical protein